MRFVGTLNTFAQMGSIDGDLQSGAERDWVPSESG